MKYFSGLLHQRFLDLKIYIRLNYRYKKQFPTSKILSLLPLSVESKIQNGTVIEENVSIVNDIEKLGRCLYIGKNSSIMSCASIGAFTSISADVKVGLMSHPDNYISTSPVFYAKRRGWVNENTYAENEGKKTVVGNDVLISANVLIRNGVKIGDGAIIGAGSFVNEDVPPYAVVVGSPAKIIRYRFEKEFIEELLALKWWDKTDEQIKSAGSFDNPVKFVAALKAQNK